MNRVETTAALSTRFRFVRRLEPAVARASSALARHPLAAIAGMLLVLTVGVFWRHVFLGYSFPWDFEGKFTATPPFVASTVGRGTWTEWVPFVGGGTPAASDPQSGLYYPLWWLMGLVRIPLTMGVLTDVQVVHVFVGALGVVALARARNLSWGWAAVAAVPYAFFGGFFGQAEHADTFRGFAYAPWLLWSLTPPLAGRRWWRITALPVVLWLIAAGAYPGDVPASFLVGGAYLLTELTTRRLWIREHIYPLALGLLGSLLIVGVVLLPYLHAEATGILYRPAQPTAEIRAFFAFQPIDALGLYLNNFAWTSEGTITAWAVGIPVIIGLTAARRDTLAKHVSLVVAGSLALVLALLPAWLPAGTLMTKIPFLFPSRFPASDYKAMIAIPLLIIAAEGWRRQTQSGSSRVWISAAVGGLLVAGVFLAPNTTGAGVTQAAWLVIGVVVLSVLLMQFASRISMRVLVAALLVLIIVDGARMTADWNNFAGINPWAVAPADFQRQTARDDYAQHLADLVANPPGSRPARTPPAVPFETQPRGSPSDADGLLGFGYYLGDYSGVITHARSVVDSSPELTSLMLQPWSAWSWPCGVVPCDGSPIQLPPVAQWTVDPHITTSSYAVSSITYNVDLSMPVVMVENELAIPGWSANLSSVHPVDVGGVFRGWQLPAGQYQFTASYVQPERRIQEVLALTALVALGCCVAVLRRQRRAGFRRRPRRSAWSGAGFGRGRFWRGQRPRRNPIRQRRIE